MKFLLDNAKDIPRKVHRKYKNVFVVKGLTPAQRQKRRERMLNIKRAAGSNDATEVRPKERQTNSGKGNTSMVVVSGYGPTVATRARMFLCPQLR